MLRGVGKIQETIPWEQSRVQGARRVSVILSYCMSRSKIVYRVSNDIMLHYQTRHNMRYTPVKHTVQQSEQIRTSTSLHCIAL